MSNDDGILILGDNEWFDDYSQRKYQCIHLTVTNSNISAVDLFMLAASRLSSQGEFLIKTNSAEQHASLISVAVKFEFKQVVKAPALSNQLVFRFNGRETKLGFQMAQSRHYSDYSRSLFEDVFESSISDKFWHWKYPKDKVISSVVALKDNKAIAHYGLCDRRAFYNNTPYGFSQAADVMVAPNERGAITSSVFYELVLLGEKPFYAANSSISLVYGFPHGRSYKLGARLKLYEPVSPIFEVIFDMSASIESNEGSCRSVDAEFVELNAITKSDVESVLELMFSAPDLLLLERSYLYLLQRYVHHPEYKYKIYSFEDSYFVIKLSGGDVFLMDYLGVVENYAEILNRFIPFISNEKLGSKLHLWCLEDISTLFIKPTQIIDTGAVFVCKRYSSNLPDFKRWWVTMGDTEFL